ncbi:MAG: phosphatidylinositol kinase [Myxococcales bacterium]|jgi:serine/threonine-protein kinase HipA|nr:phosphatidylinositol kinase [Myxococcales bacterium]
MTRKANVFYSDILAGYLVEDSEGYKFFYDKKYISEIDAKAVSLTLPISEGIYNSKTLFPFFDGLIPEGWLLEISVDLWKLDPRDRMGLLLACCKDCIGAVSLEAANE